MKLCCDASLLKSDGYGAIEERLSPLVDDTHSALPEKLGHFQVGKSSGEFSRRRRQERA